MVYGHIYFANICRAVSHLKFLAYLKSFLALGALLSWDTYLLEVKETELFFVEFIQCYLMEVVGTSKTDSATSKQSTSTTSRKELL